MKNYIYIVCFFFLTGCGTLERVKQIYQAKSIVTEKAADALLMTNEKQICNWPTIGSLERRYANNPTKYKDYHKYCDHKTQ